MNLTDRDVGNAEMLQDLLRARNKASAISSALSLTAVLATRIERGEKLYLRGERRIDGTCPSCRDWVPEESANSRTSSK